MPRRLCRFELPSRKIDYKLSEITGVVKTTWHSIVVLASFELFNFVVSVFCSFKYALNPKQNIPSPFCVVTALVDELTLHSGEYVDVSCTTTMHFNNFHFNYLVVVI